MFSMLFFIYLAATVSGVSENPYTEAVNFLTDFLLVQNKPSNVLAYICWPKGSKLHLWKKLSEHGFLGGIKDTSDSLYYSYPSEQQVFFLDAECENSEYILNQAAEMELFRQPFRWIVLGSSDNPTIKKLPFIIDSKVFLAERTNSSSKYHVKSIYRVTKNSSNFLENDIAKWSKPQGLSYFNELSIPRDRADFKGSDIRISFVITHNDTYKHLEDYRNIHIDSITKLNWLLTRYLCDTINATAKPIFRTNWGYLNRTTGIYSEGMLTDIRFSQADIGGTPAFVTWERIGVFEYFAATTPTYMRFIFRAPPLTYVTNVFTLPFDGFVWYCCFALLVAIFIIVYLIVTWEWKDSTFKEKVSKQSLALRPEVFEVVLMEIGAITQQGSDAAPKSNSGRIATIFTFTILMFLYTSYSANIVALLQSTSDSIRTLEDLLNSRMSLGVLDLTYQRYFFETAEEPIRKAVYQQKIAPKGQKSNFVPMEEGIKRVQQGSFAFHSELSAAYKVVGDIFLESEKCGLKEVEYVNLFEPFLTLKANSPYKEIFKVVMTKMREAGIRNREYNKLFTKKPVCTTKGHNFGSVGLIDVYAAFLIFGSGISLSCFLFVIEILVLKYQNRKTSVEVYQNNNASVEPEEFFLEEELFFNDEH